MLSAGNQVSYFDFAFSMRNLSLFVSKIRDFNAFVLKKTPIQQGQLLSGRSTSEALKSTKKSAF
jgi:hypothetical protein